MTEPMIEQTSADAEDFTDELSDEALDRKEGGDQFKNTGAFSQTCMSGKCYPSVGN